MTEQLRKTLARAFAYGGPVAIVAAVGTWRATGSFARAGATAMLMFAAIAYWQHLMDLKAKAQRSDLGEIGDGPVRPKLRISIRASAVEVRSAVEKALDRMAPRVDRVLVKSPTVVAVKMKASSLAWAQDVRVEVVPISHSPVLTELEIESKPVFPLAKADNGVNFENVTRLANALRSELGPDAILGEKLEDAQMRSPEPGSNARHRGQ